MRHTPNRDRVRELAGQALQYDYFANVGRATVSQTVLPVREWAEALTQVVSQEWEDYRLDARNEISGSLVSGWHDEEFGRWNELVADVDWIIAVELPKKLCDRMPKLPERDRAIRVVMNMVTLGCIEEYYRPLVPSEHFQTMVDWLRRGHLPCGAVSDFPATTLKVF